MIPIYRAKKIDSDEYVEGFLVKHYSFYAILPYDSDMISVSTDFEFSFEDIGEEFIQIDLSTLAISFDGKKFYFIEAVRYLIQLAENTPSSKLHELLEPKVTGIQE